MRADHTIYFFVAVGFGIFLLASAAENCKDTPDPKLQRAVESQGLTDVKIGDWSPMSCGQGDNISRSFTATNQQGHKVKGTVCCGLVFKDCTLRW